MDHPEIYFTGLPRKVLSWYFCWCLLLRTMAATEDTVDIIDSFAETITQHLNKDEVGHLVTKLIPNMTEEHFHQLCHLLNTFEREGDPTQLPLEHRTAVVQQLLPTLPPETISRMFIQVTQGDWEEWEE